MTTPINMALYRILLRQGATEQEAEAAAAIDASGLATKADLQAGLAELKVDLLKWTVAIVWSAIGLQTALMYFLLNRLVP
jgi:hypothetical protein